MAPPSSAPTTAVTAVEPGTAGSACMPTGIAHASAPAGVPGAPPPAPPPPVPATPPTVPAAPVTVTGAVGSARSPHAATSGNAAMTTTTTPSGERIPLGYPVL